MGITSSAAVSPSSVRASNPVPQKGARQGVGESAAPLLAGLLATLWRHKEMVLLVLDVLTVSSAFMFSFYLRFHVGLFSLPAVEDTAQYVKGAVLLTGIWVFFIWRGHGYVAGFRGLGAPMLRIRSLMFSAFWAIGTLMVISFLLREFLLSRQVYLTTTVIALSVMVLTRILIRSIERDLAAQNIDVKRLLLLGDGRQSRDFAERLQRDFPNYELVNPDAGKASRPAKNFKSAPAVKTIDDIQALYEEEPFDKIILSITEMGWGSNTSDMSDNEEGLTQIIKILNYCEAKDISLYALPDSFNIVVNQSEVASLSGIPLLRLQDAASHPGYAVVKRMMDIALSLLILGIGMPLWAAIALAIKVSSRGPVFYTQLRIGLHGKPFRMFKFRTMRMGADEEFNDLVNLDTLKVPGVKIRNDPRVTPVGRILRRISLDEIPQVLNVLLGEMTLVGPRPEMSRLVDRYSPYERRRLKGKPGITGFQQVMARNEPLAGSMMYDLNYLKEQDLLFDLYILARTLPVMVRGR